MRTRHVAALLAVALIVLSVTGPALAQSLDQTLNWPEAGFSIRYPAGWGVQAPDEQTRVLLSNPDYDINSDTPPESPTVIILAFSSEVAGMLNSAQDLLTMFAGEFGAELSTPQSMTVANLPALRIGGPVPDTPGFSSDIVAIVAGDYAYIIGAIAPTNQSFTSLFDSMLASVTIAAPTGAAPAPVTGGTTGPTTGGTALQGVSTPVNAVRVTLDQRITNNWNEIDAVELVGTDANGAEVRQWAVRAEATTEYTSSSWSAQQATGAPNTTVCGDQSTAWASATATGQDTLTLYYAIPVIPSQVNIYQTYNPGAIVLVEVVPADGGTPITVFSGRDTTTACPGVLSVDVAPAAGTTVAAEVDLAYGQAVGGMITNDDYAQEWTFNGNAGDVVTITMQASSGDLDPYLYLFDARGNELTYNDDAEDTTVGQYNAQIARFTLPASGMYTIRATRFAEEAGTSTGNYRLRLESSAAGPTGGATVVSGGGAISLGQTVTGQITNATYQQDWTFEGAAGDLVTITMIATAGDLDPYLSLLDSAGQEVVYNDDSSIPLTHSLDSQITIRLPTSGRYTIRATRYAGASGSSTGSYELTLNAGGPFRNTLPISINQTVNGQLDNTTYSQVWSFEAQAGQTVIITMRAISGDLDSYLALYDSTGALLASNDDADDPNVGSYNSQIARQSLPSAGTYYIVASRYGGAQGTSTGAYELTLALTR